MDKTRSDSAKRLARRRRWERLAKILRSDLWSYEPAETRRLQWIECDRLERRIRKSES